ncbi:MAG TPA: ATP-binding protein [Kofleriaceae bacterium]|nr:ATP-binding protein [Kofleriaceae bacterium]
MIEASHEDERVTLEHARIDPLRDRARLGVLAEVSSLLASSDDYLTILHRFSEIVMPSLADASSVHVLDSAGHLLLVAGTTDPTSERVAQTGIGELLGSLVAVPLHVRGRVLGVLTFVHGEPYGEDDLEFFGELARRVAMYVDNALLLRDIAAREAQLRDAASRLETLNQLGQELAAVHDPREVQDRVCQAAAALTGAEACVFLSEVPPMLSRPLRLDDIHGMTVPLARATSLLAAPVKGRRGDVLGAIVLGHSRRGAFDVRAEQLLVGLASLTATAIDSARLFAEQHDLIAALERSNRDLDHFAYVASHDLKAPLRGIANLTRWIEEDLTAGPTPRSRELLALIGNRVQRLEAMIEGVLDYSRAGRVADEPANLDLAALVHDVVELLAPAPGAVRIGKLPAVRALRIPLEQVFLNLIGNALKHGGKHVDVGAEPACDAWEFFVRDDGPGIAPRFHAQIWGLFQTLRSRDTTDSTGIGLAVVRRIVEAHGGRAWVESEEGRGATFRFTWPRTPVRSRSWDRHFRGP